MFTSVSLFQVFCVYLVEIVFSEDASLFVMQRFLTNLAIFHYSFGGFLFETVVVSTRAEHILDYCKTMRNMGYIPRMSGPAFFFSEDL